MSLRSGFTLGEWTVSPLEGRLSRPGEDQRIQPKSMEVLLRLAESRGDVVERDDLLRAVWGERAVSDEPLTRCIGELRRALGDRRAEPQYIQTIPKRGYRLVAPVSGPRDARAPAKPRRHLLAIGAAMLLLLAIGFAGKRLWPDTSSGVAPPVQERSIVVLPFADMSPGSDQAYLSDGIAEEVLNLLAGMPQLRVISRTSAFSFKDSRADVREIAERLGVAYVLEGSVRTAGRRIRITTQLIDARSDTHLWSQTYDRELEDIFAIQDEIAGAVVERLEMSLFGDAPRSRTTDPEAYTLFLQARYLHENPAGDAFVKAFGYYQGALEIDPSYVPAWVWLAALYDDTVYSSGLPRSEVERRAREAIDRALAIEPDNALALGMNAILIDAWDNDPARAASQMQRALDVGPLNPILLRWAAIMLSSLGRYDEAIRVMEHLLAQDPVGRITRVNLASTYLAAGRFDDAIRICRIQTEAASESGPCLAQLVVAYVYTEQSESALQLLRRVEGSRVYTRLAPMVYYSLGQPPHYEEALAVLRQAYENGDAGLAYWLGRTYALAGDTDAALDWIARAVELGVAGLTPNQAWFHPLEDDPRWASLLRKAGKSAEQLDAISLEVSLSQG